MSRTTEVQNAAFKLLRYLCWIMRIELANFCFRTQKKQHNKSLSISCRKKSKKSAIMTIFQNSSYFELFNFIISQLLKLFWTITKFVEPVQKNENG